MEACEKREVVDPGGHFDRLADVAGVLEEGDLDAVGGIGIAPVKPLALAATPVRPVNCHGVPLGATGRRHGQIAVSQSKWRTRPNRTRQEHFRKQFYFTIGGVACVCVKRVLACGGGARRRKEVTFAAAEGGTAAGYEGGGGTLLPASHGRDHQVAVAATLLPWRIDRRFYVPGKSTPSTSNTLSSTGICGISRPSAAHRSLIACRRS